jgi:hypothetical protein
MIDLNRPVKTVDGKPARIICSDLKYSTPIVAAITQTNGDEYIALFCGDGSPPYSDFDTPKLVNVPFSDNNTFPWGRDQLMAVCAVQYCLGRMTYIVRDCVDWLTANWDAFDSHTKKLIERDIEEAFTKDDYWRKTNPEQPNGFLGMDCDRAEWERARKLWEENE